MSRIMRTAGFSRLSAARNIVGFALGLSLVSGVAAQGSTPVASPEASPVASPVAVAPGQLTATRPYLIATDPSTLSISPILTAGETIGDYQMAGVPDGLGAFKDGSDVVLFVNHELTTVEDANISDARVSRLVLDGTTGAVKSGEYIYDGTEGFERLCSAYMAGPWDGFDKPTFLTGEETTGSPKGGLSVAIDGATGKPTELPWLGHIDHENQVAIPGFTGKTVIVTTDDNSDGSEVYLYVADSPADVLAGKGQLYVFKADNAAGTADIAKGTELTGTFEPIGQADNTDGDALQAAADAAKAFKFVRTEDVTYDRTNTTTIYFTDTGDDQDPNLAADGTPFTKNGRLYTMTLDPADPTKVSGFKVLLDGDKGDDILNPDNVDANKTTIMLQEDRNGYNRDENFDDTGRILAYDIASGTVTPIAKVDQSDGSGALDPGDEAGSWESSGIINVEDIYGPGAWLVDVQAHEIKVPQFGGEDEGGQLLLIRQT
ncbi:MAG: alkaline phosphatase PhoX [Thermomicrobiales bacterium]